MPLELAAAARCVFSIQYPDGNGPRGIEYSHRQMEDAGAYLAQYRVLRVN